MLNMHNIRTFAAVACWLQGTPIGGDVGDLQGQFAALQLWPFNVPSWFHDNVSVMQNNR
jgi:hypothetical protein